MRLHAFIGRKEGHGFAETLGAQWDRLEDLVHGVRGLVGESESLLGLSKWNIGHKCNGREITKI